MDNPALYPIYRVTNSPFKGFLALHDKFRQNALRVLCKAINKTDGGLTKM